MPGCLKSLLAASKINRSVQNFVNRLAFGILQGNTEDLRKGGRVVKDASALLVRSALRDIWI